MQQNPDEPKPEQSHTLASVADEKKPWQKPALEEFAITTATRNAGIINLDLDHALDVS